MEAQREELACSCSKGSPHPYQPTIRLHSKSGDTSLSPTDWRGNYPPISEAYIQRPIRMEADERCIIVGRPWSVRGSSDYDLAICLQRYGASEIMQRSHRREDTPSVAKLGIG